MVADSVEAETLPGARVQDCDGLGPLEEAVDLGVDGPGEPARFGHAKVGALPDRVGRAQQGVVAGKPSEVEEPVDLENQIMGGKGLPAGTEHALAGVPSGWAARLLIES